MASPLLALLCAAATFHCTYDFGRVWTDAAQRPARDAIPSRWDQGALRPDVGLPPDAPAPAPDQLPVDAPASPAPDTAQPASLALCWKTSSGDVATCPAGWTAVAGGTYCDDWIRHSRPRGAGDGWHSDCTSSGQVVTSVVCADQGTWRTREAAGSGKVSVSCDAGDAVVGGGCSCDSGAAMFISVYDKGSEGWSCACDPAGNDRAHVVCAGGTTAGELDRSFASAEELGEELAAPCKSGHILSGGCESLLEWIYRSDSNYGNPHNRWVCGIGSTLLAWGKARALCVKPKIPACP